MKENISKEYIAQFLPENPVIIEAGAHIGRDTKKMLKQWPQAKIHAFEPVPELFEELKKNTTPYSNVTCYPLALNNSSGTAQFYISSGRSTATSSLLAPKEYLIEHPTTVFEKTTVTTITLDAWAEKYAIPHVDFMWLDMQGGELSALQAGMHLLKTVKALYTEVSFAERYEKNPLYATIKCWLERQGFSVQKEEFRTSAWGNVLFIRK